MSVIFVLLKLDCQGNTQALVCLSCHSDHKLPKYMLCSLLQGASHYSL